MPRFRAEFTHDLHTALRGLSLDIALGGSMPEIARYPVLYGVHHALASDDKVSAKRLMDLSLIHISEPTRPY